MNMDIDEERESKRDAGKQMSVYCEKCGINFAQDSGVCGVCEKPVRKYNGRNKVDRYSQLDTSDYLNMPLNVRLRLSGIGWQWSDDNNE
jgi:ribosomal protein L37E